MKPTRLWLAALTLILLPACSRSHLREKEICYRLAHQYLTDIMREQEDDPVSYLAINPKIAYNRAADTCLCAYELVGREHPRSLRLRFVVDVMTNRVIARSNVIDPNRETDSRYEAALRALLDDTAPPAGYVKGMRD